ncbi:MAG: gamma-butyrobetaine hydroxylase-like domain-containing protein [Planctomycetaceae bacterium]
MTSERVAPTAIRRVDDAAGRPVIEIDWSDGVSGRYPARLLRDACPCATCREKRAAPPKVVGLTVLRPEELRPLAVVGMKPVGQYAYSIAFTDGHDTGIYTLDYLRELASGE